jgi:ribosome biogenesis protein Nip4
LKAEAIKYFASRFGVQVSFDPEFIVRKNGRYFLTNVSLKPFVRRDFYCIGVFLGKVKGGKFFPSFYLLDILAKKGGNRIVVDAKAAWLFICGRDVFRKGIVKSFGSMRKGDAIIVLNEFGECLGFGKAIDSLDMPTGILVVKNVLDLGDFLRREKYKL